MDLLKNVNLASAASPPMHYRNILSVSGPGFRQRRSQ